MSLINNLVQPPKWSYQLGETEEVELDEGTSEYNTIKDILSGAPLLGLTKICRLQNPYMYHRYMLRKAEYGARGIPVSERTLLHATAAHKVDSILENNLDWRLVHRDKYGSGVSFSQSPIYANKQCCRSNGSQRAMLVAKVLIGRSHTGYQSLKLPSSNYDTTVGNTNVVVKFYDDEFYPEYVAYYNNAISLYGLFRM